MAQTFNESIVHLNETQLIALDDNLATIDTDLAISMSLVRRAQGLSFEDLERRVSGIKGSTLKRYMQQSYSSMRPLHVVAAMSWVMMVPMTSFYLALKVKENYRGMDSHTVNALFCIGRLPTKQFDLYINMIKELMTLEDRNEFQNFHDETLSATQLPSCYEDLLPPDSLDLNAFAIDYYRSSAITVKRFRLENNIPIDFISRVLGISTYQYHILEDVNKTRDFSVSIGFRVKLGFQLYSHVNFTSEMVQFPQFHQLRQFQHVRDILTTKALSLVADKNKKHAVEILTNLSKIYINN
ncbi:hypothetical protein AB6D11_00750 [Vibrio splendidus]